MEKYPDIPTELSADETIKWLLEPKDPSVRYLTLTQLLDLPEVDTEVRKA